MLIAGAAAEVAANAVANLLFIGGVTVAKSDRAARLGRLDHHAEIAAIQEHGIRAYEAVDGRGLARVDFFLTDGGLYVNELNTMPGFTPISMFPKCWIASGMTYAELITELVDTALDRVKA